MDSHIEDVVPSDFAYKSESQVSQTELTPLNEDHAEGVENDDKVETKEEVNVKKVESGSLQIPVDKDAAGPGEPSHSSKTVHAPPKPGSYASGSNQNIFSVFACC